MSRNGLGWRGTIAPPPHVRILFTSSLNYWNTCSFLLFRSEQCHTSIASPLQVAVSKCRYGYYQRVPFPCRLPPLDSAGKKRVANPCFFHDMSRWDIFALSTRKAARFRFFLTIESKGPEDGLVRRAISPAACVCSFAGTVPALWIARDDMAVTCFCISNMTL